MSRKFYIVVALLGFYFLFLNFFTPAYADEVMLHLASKHYSTHEWDFNELNPGVGIKHQNFVGGIYYNSIRRISVYGGMEFEHRFNDWVAVGADLGLVTGYNVTILPMAAPYLKTGPFKFTVMPVALEDIGLTGAALGISLWFEG